MASLIFLRDERKLFTFTLKEGVNWIGRSKTCDLLLPNKLVSRKHCRIYRRACNWVIHDHSRNGTYIQDRLIRHHHLRDGDVFVIADYRIIFQLADEADPETLEKVSARPYSYVFAEPAEKSPFFAKLVIQTGRESGKIFPLYHPKISLGGKGSQLELRDPKVVSQHCLLHLSHGRVCVEPLEGRVYLNGQEVHAVTPVYTQDVLRVGQSSCRIDSMLAKASSHIGDFGVISKSGHKMRHCLGLIQKFAQHDFPVLITGESGTGKEMAAKSIHKHSTRSKQLFVTLNCGGLTESLIDSELFGYVKGAFTGAHHDRLGAFQHATGGTLFLDEVGELSSDAQAKLLRVLETGEVRKVGSSKLDFPNVRIVAATHRNLYQLVREGGFREDLLYRLGVLALSLPPLRERLDDLEMLCTSLLQKVHPQAYVTPEAIEFLRSYHWPGNVRELRNVLIRSFVQSGLRIDVEDIVFQGLENHLKVSKKDNLDYAYLRALLEKHQGNCSAIARELDIARSTLLYKLKKMGLI